MMLQMGKKDKRTLNDWIVLGLSVLLALQVVAIFLCNISEATRYIECDMAKLYVRAMEIWNSKKLLLLNWEYMTTLELDCAALPAALFYGITGNIYLAFGISNICILALYMWTIFTIFKKNENKIYPLLCLNLLVIPYGFGQLDYFNMMFYNGGQYAIKVLVPLMLVAILQNMDEKRTWRKLAFVLVYFVLLFLTGFSSGMYVFVSGVFAVFAGYFLYNIYCNQKLNFQFWVYGAVSAVLSLLGIVLKNLFAQKVPSAAGREMTLCSIEKIADNIKGCFWGMYELFDAVSYEEGIAVMSYEGINVLMRFVFVSFLLISGICMIRKCLRKETSVLNSMLLGIFVWNLFILCMCDTTYGSATSEYRYHLMGMIPLLFVVTSMLIEWYESCEHNWKLIWTAGCFAVLLALNVTSYKTVLQADDGMEYLEAVCEFAEAENIETIYMLTTSADAENCRLLDGQERLYLYVLGGGTAFSYGYYSDYNGPFEVDPESSMMVVDLKAYELDVDTVDIFNHNYTHVTSFGNFKIFR